MLRIAAKNHAHSVGPQFAAALHADHGSALLEFAFIAPIVVMLLVAGVDFGRAWYVNLEIASAAEAGALYGVQNYGDTTGMNAAASLDASDLPALSSTSSYGAECSDGSSSAAYANSLPFCSATTVSYVEVDTTAVYIPILSFPGIAPSFTMSGKSRMRTSN